MTTKHDKLAHFLVKATDTMPELACLYTGLILLAAALFSHFEAMGYWDAVWMAVVTSTSTGYGDFYPKTVGGRLTDIALMITSIFIVIPLVVAKLLSVVMVDRNQFTHEEQEEVKALLKRIAADRQGQEESAHG